MKAISPVIATVIIVAVAIAISIAVALWLTGIGGGFTTVENLQITYAYAEKRVDTQSGTEHWAIVLKVENKGTVTATIDEIFVNGVPVGHINGASTDPSIGGGISIDTGGNRTIIVRLPTDRYKSGQQVEVKLHTASGKEYPKMVTLP